MRRKKHEPAEWTLTMAGGTPTLFQMTLPDGVFPEWDPPVPGGMMPNGLGDVELYKDDRLFARGTWDAISAG